MKSDIYDLFKSGVIGDMDYHFGRFIARKEEESGNDIKRDVVELAAALISRQVSNGHICFSAQDFNNFIVDCPDNLKDLPSWDEMVGALKKCKSCSFGNKITPLVFDGKRFYLHRYWNYENRLAQAVLRMSKEESRYKDQIAEIEKNLSYMGGESDIDEGQHDAARNAFLNRFSVITGGPGTGKTTVVAKIIAALWKVSQNEKIVLAAPTGKAASRMNEALKNTVERMKDKIDEDVKEKILSLNGTSIHRLLGWTNKPGVFKHNGENPLDADLVIVDEASMIDLSLMSKLADAIPDKASLVLLGDKDQLASVEAGNVLGDICEAAQLGYIKDSVVSVLTKSYRFSMEDSIGRLATVVNDIAKNENVQNLFESCKDGSLQFFDPSESSLSAYLKKIVKEKFSDIFKPDTPENILKTLDKFRILCAVRKGLRGVEEMNRFAQTILYEEGLIREIKDEWYHGRPIMVTENNYNLELFNGDCGVVLETDSGKRAFFKGKQSETISFPVSMLQTVETVYAMTVHKSQGSEFDEISFIMPEKEVAILTKELVYTAITRAKNKVTVVSDKTLFQTSIKKSAVRNSGLVERFRAPLNLTDNQ
jgi:exodeoxyribonuclease V alpha subunit